MNIEIKRVENERQLDSFVKLPLKLYKKNPNYVPPLLSDVKRTLNPGKNPFFKHAARELFLAREGRHIFGRIAAIIDYNYIEYHKRKIGYFGFFEVENNFEIANALLDTARNWLKEKGMVRMAGPSNPALYDECGLLIEGFDSPPMIKMTYNPKYYIEFVEKYGMQKDKDLFAYLIRTDQPAPDKLKRVIEAIKNKPGLKVRSIDFSRLEEEKKNIKDIYNNAWSNNWDFAPLTNEEIDDMVKLLKPLAKPEIIPFVEINGEPAGMSIALPNYNEILIKLNGQLFPFGIITFLLEKDKIKSARLWALGVKDKFRKMGLDALLYYETFEGAKKLGIEWGEVSWILEDNIDIIRPILLWGGKLYKKYRIYGIDIKS
ncbi:MAG: hypothetical protein OEW70_01020 [candidate division WOR-3 bacterium]|nr:hypothetical protein [candidate division WOR-3 bacterium]